jgi:hypothetical protein
MKLNNIQFEQEGSSSKPPLKHTAWATWIDDMAMHYFVGQARQLKFLLDYTR